MKQPISFKKIIKSMGVVNLSNTQRSKKSKIVSRASKPKLKNKVAEIEHDFSHLRRVSPEKWANAMSCIHKS